MSGTTPKSLKIPKGVSLAPAMLNAAEERAESLGKNFSSYVRDLIERDLGIVAGQPVPSPEDVMRRTIREELARAFEARGEPLEVLPHAAEPAAFKYRQAKKKNAPGGSGPTFAFPQHPAAN